MAGSEIEPTNSTSGEVSTELSDSESDPGKPRSQSNQPTGKRSPADTSGGDMKKAKTTTVVAVAAPDATEAELGVEKKQLFQRLWSEENEIELIQGMIDYVEQKGKDPLGDVNDFYEFVNDSLNIDVNNRQVLTKARRLKKKFENNVAKVEKNGKVRSFSNPHEKKMYELSKNLWGSGRSNNVVMISSSKKVKSVKGVNKGVSKGVKVNVTPKPSKSREVVKTDSLGNGNGGGVELVTEEVIMRKGLEKMSGKEKDEMEEKWKELKVQELEFFVKKVDLLKEQAEVVLNAIAKSGGGGAK